MKEIDLIIRNSKYYVICSSVQHKLSKFIWQKKKCDYKSWKYFFYSAGMHFTMLLFSLFPIFIK